MLLLMLKNITKARIMSAKQFELTKILFRVKKRSETKERKKGWLENDVRRR